jgi:hypothetical protein
MTDTETKADAAAKQRTDDQKKHAEDVKKKLADERTAREKASKEGAKAAGEVKPTPTQEENDLAASGVHVAEHEDDGSGPDPTSAQAKEAKQSEAKPAAKGGYATRTSNPA